MLPRPWTRLIAAVTNKDGGATDEQVRLLVLRSAVVVAQVITLAVTWRLWQVRESVPHLPVFDVPDSMQFGMLWPLLASLVFVLFRPLAGIALHSGLLLLAIMLDQMRIQPGVISLAIVLWGTLPWQAAQMIARAHLISLWFYAGLHKLLSTAYWDHVGASIIKNTLPGMPQLPATAIAVTMALVEIALACLLLWPKTRKVAAWSATILHVAVFLGLVMRGWNEAVWAWNLALAVAGPVMFAWWSRPTWGELRSHRWAVRATVCFLLISPAGYYLGIVDAYLAHCLYAGNTPQAEFVPFGEDATVQKTERLLSYRVLDELNVPLPPAHRLYEQYFHCVKHLGDQMCIVDRRRWARSSGCVQRWISYDGEYVDGQKHGLWIEWHSNRRISSESVYLNGKQHGRFSSWHPDGSRAEEGSFLHGREHGRWSLWSEKGEKYDVTYENGRQMSTSQPSEDD